MGNRLFSCSSNDLEINHVLVLLGEILGGDGTQRIVLLRGPQVHVNLELWFGTMGFVYAILSTSHYF